MVTTTPTLRYGVIFFYCLATSSILIPEAQGLSNGGLGGHGGVQRRLFHPKSRSFSVVPSARKGDDEVEDNDFDGYYDEDDDDEDEDYRTQRRRRRRRDVDDLGGTRVPLRKGLDVPSSFGRRDGWRLPESVSKALLAGVFVMGVGLGVTVDSAINTNPRDLASRDAIDQAAPNAGLCATMGASAMAFDQRVFVSFNPFNVYVAQADVKPACVLRQSNVVSILREKNLIDDAEVRSCKANMNTWAFVGDLNDNPQLSCVYKSEDAQNEFLSNPKYGIGEDYLDDDRANESLKKSIKNELTEGQRQERRRIQAAKIPGLD
jgi:F0F1-type ATP synthase assembly protein I